MPFHHGDKVAPVVVVGSLHFYVAVADIVVGVECGCGCGGGSVVGMLLVFGS